MAFLGSSDSTRGVSAASCLQPELFAGGASGLLVFHGNCAAELRVWRRLLEEAESLGFSGLLTGTPGAVEYLRSLGVRRVCLVAARRQAEAALQMAAHEDADALVLISPRIRRGAVAVDLVRSVRIPRLLVGGSDPRDIDAVREIDAQSIGHVVLRFFPSPAAGHRLLDSQIGPLVGETVSLFAARVLGLSDEPNNPRSTSALEEVRT